MMPQSSDFLVVQTQGSMFFMQLGSPDFLHTSQSVGDGKGMTYALVSL